MVILVIDSSAVIIERWQYMLTEIESIDAVYGAVSQKDGIRLFYEFKPDVVMLDSDLPGNMTIDLLKEIKSNAPEIPVIILTNSIDDCIRYNYDSIRADYYFDKYNDFEKIPAIIIKISKKEKELNH